MSGKEIEARLDRSLRNQVKVPRLDGRFDAAVWARIEAEEAKAPSVAASVPSRALRASRWLAISNTVGIAVTLGVALYFGLGAFGGMEPKPLNVELHVAVPVISADTVQRVVAVLGQLLGVAAVVFGLSFTSIGRRLRMSIS